MGGFLLQLCKVDAPEQDVEQKLNRSLDVFLRKGLALHKKIVRDGFVLYRFHKLLAEQEHVLELDSGDFVVCSGTMLFDKMTGKLALTGLYEAFDTGGQFESRLHGNYCVVIYKDNQLSLFSDYARYYPVYRNVAGTVFSSSFLAVARTGNVKVSPHEFYEYLLHGFFVGEDTLLKNVQILESRQVHQLLPSLKRLSRQPTYRAILPGTSFAETTKMIAEELCEYFGMLGHAFGNNMGTALSGGYDSRLILALIRRTGNIPVVHVYGDAASSDVKVAKDIAEGEGILLNHIDKNALPKTNGEEFASNIERDLFFFDGIKPVGLFDDGHDLASRFERARKAPLQLNGAGGEIYREIWSLGDRGIDLATFLRMRYDSGDHTFCRSPFKLSDYFARFVEKVQSTLGVNRTWISRREAEVLFPFLRNWFGAPNNAANNQISYALFPYMEPKFVIPSFDVPIQFKYCGSLEASLIREIDPALARYNSAYGINFYDPVPIAYGLARRIERSIPLSIRLLKRRFKNRTLPSLKPYYLHGDYLPQLIDIGNLQISEFVDLTKMQDPELLSRALSVELLLKAL